MPIQYIFQKFIPELHPKFLNNNHENNLESVHNIILDSNENSNSSRSNTDETIERMPKVSFIRAITIFIISKKTIYI